MGMGDSWWVWMVAGFEDGWQLVNPDKQVGFVRCQGNSHRPSAVGALVRAPPP